MKRLWNTCNDFIFGLMLVNEPADLYLPDSIGIMAIFCGYGRQPLEWRIW